jgi:hypothetical protein
MQSTERLLYGVGVLRSASTASTDCVLAESPQHNFIAEPRISRKESDIVPSQKKGCFHKTLTLSS